ncbi:MAG TPA: serine/threonine protein phosphatase [Prosthecobacter sp.]
MQEAKNTVRAVVHIGYDGTVHKQFRGTNAKERFENEVRVLKLLEERGCAYVPRLLDSDPEKLKIVTSNCGTRVEHISDARVKELFDELERDYGVRHDDAFARNITYRRQDGRFCLIDFELATVINPPPDWPQVPEALLAATRAAAAAPDPAA